MSPSTRPARGGDAAVIVRVASEVWPDEKLDAGHIARLIGEGRRATQVAELDGDVVGFVDGFLTETANGERRWEVDLLAVSPRAQGHGIGTSLVRASVASAIDLDATIARGLIRVDNVASERVFATNGFAPDEIPSQLWVGAGLAFKTGVPNLYLVAVRTFRYNGLWLEELSAVGLRELRSRDSEGVVGAVIPVTEIECVNAARDAGLAPAGDYRFWSRRLH